MRDFGPYTEGYPVDNPIMFMLNAQDNQTNSLLHLATNMNDKQALTLFLKANHDYLTEKRFNFFFKDYQPKFMNAANNEGDMPIHIAAREGNTDIVHLLLENGAIFNAKNEEGYTPKELSNDHIVDQVLKSVNMFLNINDGKSKQIMQEYINKQGASVYVNTRDKNHKTALHHAVASSRIDIIKLLLQNNADPNALYANHYTPLHFAVENNNIEAVELLLKHGAYFNIKNKQGKSPFEHIENKTFDSVNNSCSNLLGSINELFIGIESDDPESTINYFKIRCLQQTYRINIETIINVRDDLGNTLLHYAADYAYRDIVKLLLQHGAIFNRKNKFDYPPINFASRDIYDLLNSINEIFDHTNCMYSTQVDMKIIRNVRNDEGMIILHAAVKEGNLNAMIALLKAGASIDAEDIHDNRPLDYAQQGHIKNILEASRDLLREVRSNNVNNVEKLIAREAVVSSSALLLAVKHGYCEIVKSMLKSFIVNVELEYILKSMDEDGNSGLHLALGHRHYEIAKILLAYAKNINDNGTTLKQLIESANHANKKPFDLSTDKNKSKEVTEAMFN
ncbi:putative ankyrin repeat protein RF_0381 [Artemia franciscana]|uniref:putative ankyrin repeat protein RF_0381 n=1 Tax=Artemia franciscana TaxID=6661 RepID=UPI0032DA51D2